MNLKPRDPEMKSDPRFFVCITATFQPRRLIVPPAADGCKCLLAGDQAWDWPLTSVRRD
jgi:hypothetical protein